MINTGTTPQRQAKLNMPLIVSIVTVTHGTQQLHKGLGQILVVLEQCAEGKLICALER